MKGGDRIHKIIPILLPTPFPEGSVNAYLVLGDIVTLVDTGTWHEDSVLRLEEAMQAEGLAWGDIQQMVVTHMHTDHSGGVAAIQKNVGIPVYVHERARIALEGGRAEFDRVEAYYQAWFHACGLPTSDPRNRKFRPWGWKQVRYLTDGDTVTIGSRPFHVVYAPGHSQTDIYLYDSETGDALVGDHLLKDISANALVEPPAPWEGERPKTLLQYRASMRKTRDMPLRQIYPGHGTPFVGHRDLIDRRFAEQVARCEKILEHVQAGKRTIFEISRAMFPWLKENGVFLGLSEVLGHMDLLMEERRVEVAQEDGVMRFAPR